MRQSQEEEKSAMQSNPCTSDAVEEAPPPNNDDDETSGYLSGLRLRRATMRSDAMEAASDESASEPVTEVLTGLSLAEDYCAADKPGASSSSSSSQQTGVCHDNDNNNNATLLQKLIEQQTQTTRSVTWLAEQMRETHRTTQFLMSENALLRSRRTERELLGREMHMQQQIGQAASMDTLSMQVVCVARQQAAVIEALRAFSVAIDMPPAQRQHWQHHTRSAADDPMGSNDHNNDFDEIMECMRWNQQMASGCARE